MFFLIKILLGKYKGWLKRRWEYFEREDTVRIKGTMMVTLAIGLFLLSLWANSMWGVPVIAIWIIVAAIVENLYCGMK